MPEPSRTEVIERLREHSEWLRGKGQPTARDLLSEAADLLEAEESRTEYRVVGENFRGDPMISEPLRRLSGAEYHLENWEIGSGRGRIQQRTVTETEWTDVEGEVDRG